MGDLQPKKLKVAELKAELSARGLPVDGLKAVLCARLEEALLAQTDSPETQQVRRGPVVITHARGISPLAPARSSEGRDEGFPSGLGHAALVGGNRVGGPAVYPVRLRRVSPLGWSESSTKEELTGDWAG